MKKLSLQKFSIIWLLVFITPVPDLFSQQWTKIQGTSLYLNGIFLSPQNPQLLMVSSDDLPTDFSEQNIGFPYFGVGQNGFKISTDGGNSFSDPILQGYSVYNLHQAADNTNHWFASVRRFTRGGVLSSSDGGKTWDTDKLKCSGNFQITKIISKKNNSNELELYASAVNTDEGFKYSFNNFDECFTNEDLDIQSLDIAISPLDANLMFIAGDGFHNSGVYRTYDNGKTWLKDSAGLENKRVLCVLPSAFNKAWVLCGVDSIDLNKFRYGKGIYLSQDTGKSWKRVGAFGSTVFALAQHPFYPKFIAAACDRDGVYLSGSFGWSWERFSEGLPKDSSVRQVAIPAIDSTKEGIIVYAGVFGEGLYKSIRIKTSVETPANQNSKINISPNPAEEYIEIRIPSREGAGGVEIKIYNLPGECVLSVTDAGGTHPLIPSQEGNIRIDVSGLPPGIYFVRVGDWVGRFVKI
jgi:photosystem II stability/assembly factor-like uncharacterized protein